MMMSIPQNLHDFLRLLTPEHETRVWLTVAGTMSWGGAVAGTGVSCGPWIGCRRPGKVCSKPEKSFRENIDPHNEDAKEILPTGHPNGDIDVSIDDKAIRTA